jgi:hypothetical protein
MAFRFLLLGAVAALGFDLPQGIDVDGLARSGRAWWHARVSEIEARHGIALAGVEDSSLADPSEAPGPVAPDADEAFATVIEDVVSAFVVDGVIESKEEPESSSQLVAGVDDAAYGPDFADALNRWADGLSEPAEPATLAAEAGETELPIERDPIFASISGFAGSAFHAPVVVEGGVLDPASEAASAVPGAGLVDPSDSTTDDGPGFARAVQLTGQALQAWFALIQPGTPSF